MKLPRDLPGNEVARLLTRHYGYRVTRTRGNHMTVTLTIDGIIADVAEFLGLSKHEVRETLFG